MNYALKELQGGLCHNTSKLRISQNSRSGKRAVLTFMGSTSIILFNIV